MAFFFKYIAARLWTGLFFGGLATFAVLPLIPGPTGIKWAVIPGLLLCVAAFWLADRIFSVIGDVQFNRLMREVTAWERAGMDREARQILAKAESAANSFLFSPGSRKWANGRLMARIARLELASGLSDAVSENVVAMYLRRFPQDRDAAVRWLDGVLAGQTEDSGIHQPAPDQIHDIAARIGRAHTGDLVIQQMLARFYLLTRRCDFDALHTYQILMDGREPVPEPLVNDIADLFLSCHRADSLALQVYLAVHRTGNRDIRLLSGIAACRRMIRETDLSLPFLEQADAALADFTPFQQRDMAEVFLPDERHETEVVRRRPGRWRRPQFSFGVLWASIIRRIREGSSAWRKNVVVPEWREFFNPVVRKRIRMGVLGVSALVFCVLIINTILYFTGTPHLAELPPPPATPLFSQAATAPVQDPVTDPLTLQAAAYLKEADARKFVDRLKNRGIDAYWTWTVSGDKTWYQVRISHFKTKADARAYGDALKARQIIRDYYITNYVKPETR
ncbi:SPOR domain-containing protein [Desulfosarcina sp. OttesenSCG-928-G17]|nr:SPOR domain-containing protein [Desulfosarcina sp. OttesenSCG-928-G17]